MEEILKKVRSRRPRPKPAPVITPHWTALRHPPTNGAREVTRRRAAIVAGRLRAENGLVV